MLNNIWQLQDAKNKLSSLVSKARRDGPQIITKHGKEAAVVLSFEDYRKLSKPETDLLKFLQTSPLANIELDIERAKQFPRDIEL
ncbi:MAG: type II toxin-antitoxin system Phd/YefM family antitoxin [bacterium]